MRIQLRKFFLFELPNENGSEQADHGNRPPQQQRLVQQHRPVSACHLDQLLRSSDGNGKPLFELNSSHEKRPAILWTADLRETEREPAKAAREQAF